jgi:hypothetical protein
LFISSGSAASQCRGQQFFGPVLEHAREERLLDAGAEGDGPLEGGRQEIGRRMSITINDQPRVQPLRQLGDVSIRKGMAAPGADL